MEKEYSFGCFKLKKYYLLSKRLIFLPERKNRKFTNTVLFTFIVNYWGDILVYFEADWTSIFPDELIILVVGDRETVVPQLEALNLGPLTELDRDGNVIAAI